MWRLKLFCFAAIMLLAFPSFAIELDEGPDKSKAPARSSYLLATSVMSSGGSPGTSTNFSANGTLGQPTPIGVGSSAGKVLYAGFWGKFWVLTPIVDALVPEVFKNLVFQNFPNPFNPSTTIEYSVAKDRRVEIAVFNVRGEKVATVTNEMKPPGRYKAVWNGRDDRGREVSSGVYFYRLEVGDYSSTKKMLMLK